MTEMKRKIDKYVIIIGDFTTPLSVIDRTSRQNISKDVKEKNNTINLLDLTDIYRTIHQTMAKYIFLSNSHGTFTKRNHMNDHKTSLHEFKRMNYPESIL